ncbi:MAG: ribonuclease P protein component [candidate division WOR-3 bacterium]
MKLETLTAQEVKSLTKEGKWKRFQFYSICYKDATSRKFAFSASRKANNKVIRNKIKRILREIIRQNLEFFPTGHFLIVGSTDILNLNFTELSEMLKKDFQDLKKSFPESSFSQ